MKLWRNLPYLLETKGLVQVVVMADTRQQAIEKASAGSWRCWAAW